jgi:hypothetical protein
VPAVGKGVHGPTLELGAASTERLVARATKKRVDERIVFNEAWNGILKFKVEKIDSTDTVRGKT